MRSNTMVPEDQMMTFILGKWISKPIYVAAKLGIADILADGPQRAETLAAITATHAGTLYRMMRALASVGIFTETAVQTFGNTPLSECLRRERLQASALLFHAHWHDLTWDNLLYSIRTGIPAFEHLFGVPLFEWLENHPDEAQLFHAANAVKAASCHSEVAAGYDFSKVTRLMDVGGGLGGLIIQILKQYPPMQGIIAERPNIVQKLNQIIPQHSLEERLSAVECDFFKAIPKGSDTYLLSHILHDWPDDKSMIILKNCRKAMGTSGKLLIIEALIPPENTFSIYKFLDLEVLLMGGGCERTQAELEELLQKSSFQISQITMNKACLAIIEAIPL